ncbi:MAG TPA: protein translocase subunit SecD [Flavobacteriales bacterium]|nr:protein translocase subunit SecD [Flavobacteriales bacterium]HQY00366.1 protein translocase subunit SecD [Flavobacteriales bacterium]
MQNRGALWIFTILLALACTYQLSFSVFTSGMEKKARVESNLKADSVLAIPGNEGQDRDALRIQFENSYLRARSEEKVYPILGYTYGECKEKEINLGLDLRGGMAVTLEVSIPELVVNLSENSEDPAFRTAIANARERQKNSDQDFITLFGEEYAKVPDHGPLSAIFYSPDRKGIFDREGSDEDYLTALRGEATTALNNTEKILRTRIDKFGVAQPSIQKQTFSGRIQIELPGVKDKERVRKVLQSTANLQFWETADNEQVFPSLKDANDRMGALAMGSDTADVPEFSHTLTSGVEIKGAGTGVESGLVGFLTSGQAVDKDAWFNFDRVTFATGSATIDMANSESQLGNLVEIMNAYSNVRLKIGGYTDNTGDSTMNKALSQQRAEAVTAALVAKGIASDRLEAEGYGPAHPVANNDTEEGRAQNRRMALRVLDLGADADTADALETDTTKSFDEMTEAEKAEARQKNPLFSVFQPSQSRGAVLGSSLVADTAQVNAFLKSPTTKSLMPADVKLVWGAKPETFELAKGGSAQFLTLYALRVPRGGEPKLDGSSITNAYQDFDMKGDVEVIMQMDAEGAQTWKVMTGDNVGRAVAIVLDELVYSAPIVQSEIAGGRSSISMGTGDLNNQIQEADDLANILKAGALPAPARIIDETVVGPSLGGENIKWGMISFAIALLIVMIYMILYYNTAGWVADLALLVNLFVLIGSLASLQAALTLPGIAGIVLTMGMAVDANVLIYERIREELRHGKMLKSAVDLGFKGAMSAIIDSNVTTLITAVILYIFGSGPIRGFATTLGLGILTSLFTALFLSRMIISRRLEQGKPFSVWTGWSKNIFVNANFDFMAKRKVFYTVSGIVITVGIVSMFTNGFNWGVDFSGGRTYVVKFQNEVKVDAVESALKPNFVTDEGLQSGVNVKTYGGSSQVKITTNFMSAASGEGVESIVDGRLETGLKTLGNDYEIIESRKVDATISDDIKTSAVTALGFALLFIFLYVAVRFSNWQFGLAGLLSLTHDALFVLGLYSLLYKIMPFSMEIDEAFIAAILTVIGYSINDTVVVFDRIREYMLDHKRETNEVVFNKAINSTLGRTMNTAMTTLLVLIVIFFFGGVSIQGFIFALFIGILVGTYSSVFVASSLVVDLLKGKKSETKA